MNQTPTLKWKINSLGLSAPTLLCLSLSLQNVPFNQLRGVRRTAGHNPLGGKLNSFLSTSFPPTQINTPLRRDDRSSHISFIFSFMGRPAMELMCFIIKWKFPFGAPTVMLFFYHAAFFPGEIVKGLFLPHMTISCLEITWGKKVWSKPLWYLKRSHDITKVKCNAVSLQGSNLGITMQ